MDPPLVGSHCSHIDCHNHDFLPTKCLACKNLYCMDHYFPDAHDCAASASSSNATLRSSKTDMLPCSLEGCSSPCLESYVAQDIGEDSRTPATCSRCSLSFCSQHRFPDAHYCKVPTPLPDRNAAAKALLAKNFPSHDKSKKEDNERCAAAPSKRRQKSQGSKLVQLMRMRQSAVPGDPKAGHIDVHDRLHIQAKVDQSDSYKAFWFRKSISTGRTFDLLQQRLGVSSLKSWMLLKDSDDTDEEPKALTAFDKTVSEEFEDGAKIILRPTNT